MKKEIKFICQWGRNRRTAWSGTYLSILNGLEKHYAVTEIPIKTPFLSRVYQILEKRVKIFSHKYQCKDIKKAAPDIVNSLSEGNICAFTFCEIPFKNNVHSYIYQDMCVDYILNVILKTPELKNHYSYKKVCKKSLQIRNEAQKQFYGECKGIFTMGKWLADYLEKELGVNRNKIHCVGAGIDIDVNKIAPQPKTNNKILFVGKAFFEAKGGYVLAEAFKVLREKYIKDAELYIVGPENNPFEEAFEGLHFEGLKNVDELFEYYNKCDIFVMPSYIDAYGKVFAEALSCGLPCIARRAFAMQDMIEDGKNGYLIDNDDIESFAQKMRDLLLNNDIKQYVYSHMKDYQEMYSWDAVAQRMADVINKDEYMHE
ncbi:MAG: glycosyltransferase family 4 protein [Lachnospiraceae bacterium]|nr:glycosyltransferase family 4 protein [Lachnospiraceae bacterium]